MILPHLRWKKMLCCFCFSLTCQCNRSRAFVRFNFPNDSIWIEAESVSKNDVWKQQRFIHDTSYICTSLTHKHDLYIVALRIHLRGSTWAVCAMCFVWCCGVGNKLRDSWKETRFYFLTQPWFVFLSFVFVVKQNNDKHKPHHTYTYQFYIILWHFHSRVGRVGVSKILTKDLSEGD